MKNNRFGFWSLSALCLTFAAGAHAAPRSVYFWSSAVGSDGLRSGVDGARLGTWGNGKFEDSRSMLYEGAPTLKITTRNFREGVRFDLKTPLDIQEYRNAGYLRLRLHFQDSTPPAAVGGTPGGFGLPGGLGL